MMTKQEMFDRAWRGLSAQQWRKSEIPEDESEIFEDEIPDSDGKYTCLYNGGNGRRCGWGHIDPIGTADPKCEGKTVGELAKLGIGIAAELNKEMLTFAKSIQSAHDLDGDMRRRMRAIAVTHDLVIPGLS